MDILVWVSVRQLGKGTLRRTDGLKLEKMKIAGSWCPSVQLDYSPRGRTDTLYYITINLPVKRPSVQKVQGQVTGRTLLPK